MMDQTDRKILHTLNRDARASVETVAEAVGLSPTPVRRRIRRMEGEGLIRGYRVDVDMKKCGYGLKLYAFVKLQSRDQQTIAEFERRVRSQPEILSCNLVTGPHDYVLELHMTDMESYNIFLREVLAELPAIFGIETSVVIGPVKHEMPLPY